MKGAKPDVLETARKAWQEYQRKQAGLAPTTETGLSETVRSAAVGVLNEAKARIIEGLAPGARFTIAIWRATDGPLLREALRILGLDRLPLIYLEDARVPEEYRRYGPPKLPLRGQLSLLEAPPGD